MRRLFQFILAIPIYVYAPFSWIPLAAAFDPTKSTSMPGRLFAFYWGAAAIGGLIALPISIFSSDAGLKEKKKRWVMTTIGLISGLSLAIFFICASWPSANPFSSRFELVGAWAFGGPAVVAVWNLWRFWKMKKEPNQPSQPTPGTGSVSNLESPARRG